MAGPLLVGGHAMMAVFYMLLGIMTFGACYAIYGLEVAIARVIRSRLYQRRVL